MTLVRRVAAVAALAGLCALALSTIGWPDPRAFYQLVTGQPMTDGGGSALVSLIVWLLLAALVAALLSQGARTAIAGHVTRPGRRRALAVLVVGVALLSAGVARHLATYQVCCQSAVTDQEAAALAH